MKKYLIISLLSLIFMCSLPASAVKTINANPVNLAAVIVEMVDSAKIQSEFDYYGYTLQGTEDGYKIMKTPNGHEIRYSFQDTKAIDNHPVVIVHTAESAPDLDKRLDEMQFIKDGHTYIRVARRDENHLTKCFPNSSNTLLFQSLNR